MKIKMNHKLECKKDKSKEINIKHCNKTDCPYYEPKEKKQAKLRVNKPIKRVSKNRVFVSDKTYNIVLEESKGKCALCDARDNLQYHHIYYRSERKDLIDDPSNGIMLCHQDFSVNKCHRVVHSNKKKYQPLLLGIKKEPSLIG